ncbi:MAG: response regulator transcription factor [Rhodothermaceae bacterium]
MKILVIEDNKALSADICKVLGEESFLVETALTFSAASEKLSLYNYDLLILDIGLPDGNGLDLIPYTGESKENCGILILSAKNSIDDKVNGLDLGADDYLTKPFHPAELIARVKSIIRRKNFQGSDFLEFNEIKIDLKSAESFVNDIELNLTKKEYELLLFFLYNKNRLLTKENIAEHLWGDSIDSADNFDFIYSHIKNLRKKMINAGCKDYIKSKYGVGYKFISE